MQNLCISTERIQDCSRVALEGMSQMKRKAERQQKYGGKRKAFVIDKKGLKGTTEK